MHRMMKLCGTNLKINGQNDITFPKYSAQKCTYSLVK